ncbi:branched-chain amino acid ABC transporter permease [Ferrimicrobium sp.]|uniref:branched-chain amino acid ABC transporter permease n=1 Tax=Ferrimicrobium sp. TaxID=2926050 RepID=UPI0026382447|nr:branched-chain amino acid ABC transporter permease [Ferrimicrobium sp.]
MTSPLTRVRRPFASAEQEAAGDPTPTAWISLLVRRPLWRSVVLVLLLILIPLVITGATFTTIAVYCLMYMGIATAWNSFSGFSGYVSLGHAVFFGVGAYTMALLSTHWNMSGGLSMFALLPLAGVIAALIAIPYGYVALRTRRHTFVVITIAFFFIFQLLAFNLSFTGGSAGVVLPNGQFSAADYNDPFYYACLVVLVLTVAVAAGIRRSRFGLQLFAIRDDEDRARSLGVKVNRVKITSFAVSAVPVAMMGAVWAFFIGQIYPQFAFNPALDVTIALMAFIGGFGTIIGPLLGALVLEALQRYLNLYLANADLYLVIYGLLFLVVISFLPEGILPSIAGRLRQRRLRSQNSTTVSTQESR